MNIWANLRDDEQPSADFMGKYVGHYFKQEINYLHQEHKKQSLSPSYRDWLFFLEGLLAEYNLAAKCKPQDGTAIADLMQDVKSHLNAFSHQAKSRLYTRLNWYDKRCKMAQDKCSKNHLHPLTWSYPRINPQPCDKVAMIETNQKKNPTYTGIKAATSKKNN